MGSLGEKPERFHEGDELSATALNRIVSLVLRSLHGGGDINVRDFGDRKVISSNIHTPVLPGASNYVRQFVVLEIGDDLLLCSPFNVPNDGTYLVPQPYLESLKSGAGDLIYVAKPYYLQRAPWDGKEVEYNEFRVLLSYTSDGRSVLYPDGSIIEEIIRPSYAVGDVISAMKTATGYRAGSGDVYWMDLNHAGRTWGPPHALSGSEGGSGPIPASTIVPLYRYKCENGYLQEYRRDQVFVGGLYQYTSPEYWSGQPGCVGCGCTGSEVLNCEACLEVIDEICVTFPGVQNAGDLWACTECDEVFNATNVVKLVKSAPPAGLSTPCYYVAKDILSCVPGEALDVIFFAYPNIPGMWVLQVYRNNTGVMVAHYRYDGAAWDCSSPLVLPLTTGGSNQYCNNWPSTVTVVRGPCEDFDDCDPDDIGDLCVEVFGGQGNCSCVSGFETLNRSGDSWTGTIILANCAGDPELTVTITYGSGTHPWTIEVSGCGETSATYTDLEVNCFRGSGLVIAIDSPNDCCGVDPEDGFFIRILAGQCGSGGPSGGDVEGVGLGTGSSEGEAETNFFFAIDGLLAGETLVVNVQSIMSDEIPSVVTLVGVSVLTNFVSSSAGAGDNRSRISTWVLENVATSGGTIQVHYEVPTICQANAVMVKNLADRTPSQSAANQGTTGGTAVTNQTGSETGFTFYANAAFGIVDQVGFTWQGGFTSGGQDVSTTIDGVTWTLTEGYKIYTSAVSTEAELDTTDNSEPYGAALLTLQ